ncbi:hypothetical protein [Gemmata sp.]|uniref:hypothetical protein n=1 Tax=Gemmata sp. TaxID=1914242 RepID=UPI003F6E5CB3
MIQRFIPLIALAAILGCAKPDKDAPGGPAAAPEGADSNVAYAIAFRAPATGDKYDVVRVRSGSMTAVTGNSSQTQHEKVRVEYVETIVDAPPGESRPAKLSRFYRVAERSEPGGGMKNYGYAGKTVTAVKQHREREVINYKYVNGAGVRVPEKQTIVTEYDVAIEGQAAPPSDQREFEAEFTHGGWGFEAMLPRTPAKVGEGWAVDLEAVKSITGNFPYEYHKEKSSASGRLTRTYKKDGQQCGVIEWKIDMVLDTQLPNGSPIRGSLPSTVTFDGVIDGTARVGKSTLALKGTIDHRDQIGHEVKTTIEGTQDVTITPVK